MSHPLPADVAGLPAPGAEALAHSSRLIALIAAEIAAAGGMISFARFMELALYAPGLGYYSAGARKFGRGGDFVTAPELGHLFARAIARQVAQCVEAGLRDILEIGAGTGRFARNLLAELAARDRLPRRYLILETSAGLKSRQRELLHHELERGAVDIAWIDALPSAFDGLILANEVLDAMPVHRVATRDGMLLEHCVALGESGALQWSERPAAEPLRVAAAPLKLPPHDYVTELPLAAQAYTRTLASRLRRGVALFVDYGFAAHEYYHPQRAMGTLMCHYRHRAHDDPLALVGLQDITAHVDFSAIARAGSETGLNVLGYASQARFLVNCGITEILSAADPADPAAYLPLAAEAQTLLSPAEMGELFKVIALGKHADIAMLGFRRGDKRHTL